MFEFDSSRLDKLAVLRDAGIAPYPHNLHVSHTTADVLALIGDRDNDALAADETTVTIAGRLISKREMGKAGFARIQDRAGNLQVFVRKNDLSEDAFVVWKKLDLGDHIHLTGRFMRTRTGEATVRAGTLTLAAKCIAAMPDKHKGVEDREFRSRNRYVDLFVNEESRQVFRRRSQLVAYIRRYFEDRDFMEVETPMMQVIPGGASARPFITRHNALGMDLYLRVAPELFLKRLVVGGFERVYEVNRNFRNEGVSTKHNPEFTMLEFYWSYATWHDLMDLTEELIAGAAQKICGDTKLPFGDHVIDFSRPWRRASMGELIAEATGIPADSVTDIAALRTRWLADHPADADDDLPTTMGAWWEWFFDAYVEDGLIQPTFVTGFPAEISPLSRRRDGDPDFVDRFELIIAGNEIANGFNELNDPVDQAERFSAQVVARDSGDAEAMHFDGDYINALTYGLPPTAGEGIGIDRLVMLLTNRESIRDVILFPTLRPIGGQGNPATEDSSPGDAG